MRKRDGLTKGQRLMSNILKKGWIARAKIFYDEKKWDKGVFLVGVVDLSRIWYNNCILRGSLRQGFFVGL